MLDIILIVISALCMIAGLAGCILPFLPGPPIAYVGLIILHFTDKVQYSTTQLIVWLLIVAVLQVLDYFTPMLGSKYSGGMRASIYNAMPIEGVEKLVEFIDRKSTRLNSSHWNKSRMPSSA